MAEAVIRYAFGEEELLAGVGVEDLRTLLFLLPYAIVSEQNIEGASLDVFVANVIKTADEG
ncbi:MAG TPA: hypothetical protein VE172_09180 [Stackebrandtia sp.]|uniref:hypothetical protein n=1 Tax=Stackebrandtia sp. TaxID=2023065 RepID=UPI002D4CCBE4|nr:hypothetical protein [Stackebrandtia sp.]HZE38969.1 hypothetical protein [Stackebrandtia sp.]